MLFDVAPQPGNIPAYAGRTQERSLNAPYRQKHPRIRGENTAAVSSCAPVKETSPHTRGEPGNVLIPLKIAGNIPAYAGRTIGVKDSEVSYQKHPRIRGENEGFRNIRGKIKETSPHTRGELKQKNTRARPTRNIPAYAGRTWFRVRCAVATRKHPRIRGEN